MLLRRYHDIPDAPAETPEETKAVTAAAPETEAMPEPSAQPAETSEKTETPKKKGKSNAGKSKSKA